MGLLRDAPGRCEGVANLPGYKMDFRGSADECTSRAIMEHAVGRSLLVPSP
jgi:hypothetical protein